MTSPAPARRSIPVSITLIRVLLTLSGFLSVVNGVIELGPASRLLAKWIGVALLGIGAASWLMVYRLRQPGPSLYAQSLVLVAAVVSVRVVQFFVFESPGMLPTLILPPPPSSSPCQLRGC
jgi:hypothetical protein